LRWPVLRLSVEDSVKTRMPTERYNVPVLNWTVCEQ